MRALSTNTLADLSLTVTRPTYIVYLGLASPLRFSARETITYDGNTYTAAGLRVDLGAQKLELFNYDLSYTSAFLAASGASVIISMLYGDSPFVAGDADVVFEGEIGALSIGEWIGMQLRETTPMKLPRLFCSTPAFNHLPRDGLRIQTPSGVFKLERGA